MRRIPFAIVAVICINPYAMAADYYVANDGRDDADGLTPATAWRTLARLGTQELKPGDVVHLQRGDAWREQLIPRSGDTSATITYTAYGEGPKPTLIGSVELNDAADWRHEGGNIWSTVAPRPGPRCVLSNPSFDTDTAGWSLHHEQGARANTSRDTRTHHTSPASCRITCEAAGSAPSHIQVYVSPFAVKQNTFYRLVFYAKATKPVTIHMPHLMKSGKPWDRYSTATTYVKRDVGTEWTRCEQLYLAAVSADDARLTLFLGTELPAGVSLWIDSFQLAECEGAKVLPADVGNIIFDGETSCGVKVWEPSDLKRPGQYWYDEDRHVLKLVCERNPAEHYRDIECAIRRHIIDQTNRHHVIYEHLALKYGAAHGIGGANAHHIIVRDCDVSYIGGGDQRGGKHTVRYGNGIEFWAGARNCLVERCRLWEIYDAALTNQSSGPKTDHVDIVYRHNLIWNCEYSFEYWNRPERSQTRNVRFENNTCLNAGHGWGHTQRPDPSGRHLCFYTSPAELDGLHIRNNIFYQAKGNAFYAPTWPAETARGLVTGHNCWHQPEGVMVRFAGRDYTMAQFDAFRSVTGLEKGSILAVPKLRDVAAIRGDASRRDVSGKAAPSHESAKRSVATGPHDAARLDLRLAPGSPCIDVGCDVGFKRDAAGTPIPQGPRPDIGAYEFKP